MTLILIGVFAALVQLRRLTEGSISQNSALTAVQGYIEQMKNMEFGDLPYLDASGALIAGPIAGAPAQIPTRLDESTTDSLTISTVLPIPATETILSAGEPPAGVVENLKTIDINQTPDNASDDLQLRLWVWVQDVSDSSIDATQVRSMNVIYAWDFFDGTHTRRLAGAVRTIRSSVRTN